MKKKYLVDGMSCSACSSSVERVVKRIKGVENATVNLTAKLLVVEGKFTDSEVFTAVKKAGFTLSYYTNTTKENPKTDLFKRIIPSIALLLVLMYVAMGEMLKLPYPTFISKTSNAKLFILAQIILALPILILNRKYFINGFKGLFKGSANMDTLVAVGSLCAFLYGTYAFVRVLTTTSQSVTNSFVNNLYFEASAMIVTVVGFGKYLEGLSKQNTQSVTQKLKKLTPEKATILIDNKESVVDVSSIKVGDILVIKVGDSISADGVIIDGSIEVDESSLTGESMPIYKEKDSLVKTATICVSGYATVKVTATNEDTIFSKIIEYVLNAEASKAPIQRIADKISGIFVPIIMGVSLITLIVWLIIGKGFDFALSMAISVLVVSCPCALGLATPVAITVGIGKCSENGILIKNAEVLENIGLTQTVFMDKTGTITNGKVEIVGNYLINDSDIKKIASIESKNSHPLSYAVVNYAKSTEDYNVENYSYQVGKGVSGVIDDNVYKIGNKKFVDINSASSDIVSYAENSVKEGKTPLYVEKNGVVIGLLEAFDKIKQSSFTATNNFNEMQIKTVVLSGDDKLVINSVKNQLKVTEAYGEMLPSEKAEFVKKASQTQKTMFIGDGVNDSPALTVADIGVALSAGTDIAMSSGDIILLKNDISDCVKGIKIGKKTRRIIKQNLFWAFFYNIIGIPIACGALYPLGIVFNPMISSLLMSISSIFVVTNALRIKRVKGV